MTKQELIESAYGEHWTTVIQYVDDNGWISTDKFHYYQNMNGMSNISIINIFGFNGTVGLDVEHNLYTETGRRWRPSKLKGIEHNNGWTNIEENGMPEKEGRYLFVVTGYDSYQELYYMHGINMIDCTHWRPIVEIPKPIY